MIKIWSVILCKKGCSVKISHCLIEDVQNFCANSLTHCDFVIRFIENMLKLQIQGVSNKMLQTLGQRISDENIR